ncbi:MAG: phosphoribosylformylglycinamidine synthase subunit PurS [Bacteroidia bacterium]|nr:phosphoribosylformylglycinamidine synthase subunit PurS [Bacteroidia bacterium]MDW8235156.1 phosphoribosylformylglycinamidine synthase subunit PurS [Bacteroidia bacterium]
MPLYEVWVIVLPRPALLDPEGETILAAAHRMGDTAIQQVRAGRTFALHIQAHSAEEATVHARSLAEKLLHNPIVETFTLHLPAPLPQTPA